MEPEAGPKPGRGPDGSEVPSSLRSEPWTEAMNADWATILDHSSEWARLTDSDLVWAIVVGRGTPMEQREINYVFYGIKTKKLGRSKGKAHRAVLKCLSDGRLVSGPSNTYVANPSEEVLGRVAAVLRRPPRQGPGALDNDETGVVGATPLPSDDAQTRLHETAGTHDVQSVANLFQENRLTGTLLVQQAPGWEPGRKKPERKASPLSLIDDYFLSMSSRAVSRRSGIPKSTVWDRIKREANSAPKGIQLSKRFARQAPWGQEAGVPRPKVLALDAAFFGHKPLNRLRDGRKANHKQFVYTHIVDVLSHDPLDYFVARSYDDLRGRSSKGAKKSYKRQLYNHLKEIAAPSKGHRDTLGIQPQVVVTDLDKIFISVVRKVFFRGRKDLRGRIVGCYFHFKQDLNTKLPTLNLARDIANRARERTTLDSPWEVQEKKQRLLSQRTKLKRYYDLKDQLNRVVLAEDAATQMAYLNNLRRVKQREAKKGNKKDKRVITAIDYVLTNIDYFPPIEELRRLGVTNRQINWAKPEANERETGPTNNVCESHMSLLKRFWKSRKGGFRSVRSFGKMVDYYWYLYRKERYGDPEEQIGEEPQ